MILSNDEPANYVIEVILANRPTGENYFGSIQVFKVAGSFGYGDQLLALCPTHGCMGMFPLEFSIPPEFDIYEGTGYAGWPLALQNIYDTWYVTMVTCHHCGVPCAREQLADSYGFQLPINRLADRIARFLDVLNFDADIYLVRNTSKTKLQDASRMIRSGRTSDDVIPSTLNEARKREQAILTKSKLAADSATKPLTTCIASFLRA